MNFLHAMSAAGRQVQCRKAGSTGIPSADLDTVPSLLEGRTVPAMESKHWGFCYTVEPQLSNIIRS
jgi:hypothetical protein